MATSLEPEKSVGEERVVRYVSYSDRPTKKLSVVLFSGLLKRF
jgi:hypothetical protein